MEPKIDEMRINAEIEKKALRRFRDKLAKWDVVMPKVEPLVMDFGLGEFDKVGLIEYWIANEIEAGYCGKYLFLFDGQQCPYHSHNEKHESFFVVKGKIRMVVGGDERVMSEGDVLVMPPGDIHSFFGVGDALVLEMSKPCILSDNIFEDARIATWLTSAGS